MVLALECWWTCLAGNCWMHGQLPCPGKKFARMDCLCRAYRIILLGDARTLEPRGFTLLTQHNSAVAGTACGRSAWPHGNAAIEHGGFVAASRSGRCRRQIVPSSTLARRSSAFCRFTAASLRSRPSVRAPRARSGAPFTLNTLINNLHLFHIIVDLASS